MTKTKLFFTAFIALFSTIVQAQKTSIKWSEENKTTFQFASFVNGASPDFIKLSADVHVDLLGRNTTVKPVLTKYDNKLIEKTVKKIEIDNKQAAFSGLMNIKGKLFMLTHTYDRAIKTTNFYIRTLNINTLNIEGETIDLGTFDATDQISRAAVNLKLSKDSSKTLISGYTSSGKEKYYMGVYDSDMKKQWDNTLELPYKNKYIEILDKAVTNDSKVAVIIKHYDQEISLEAITKDRTKIPSYKTELLIYEKGNTSPSVYILNPADKFVHDMQFADDNSGVITLFGLYKDHHNGSVAGFFINTVNSSTKELSIKKMANFSSEFVEQIKIDKQAGDDVGIATYYKLKDIVTRDDGSNDYILEYLKTTLLDNYELNYQNNGLPQNAMVKMKGVMIECGNIIDIHVKVSGAVTVTRIPKMQTASFPVAGEALSFLYFDGLDFYNSFKALSYKNGLLLFYNDSKDNLNRSLTKKPDAFTDYAKTTLAMSAIDENDNLSRAVIADYKGIKLVTLIKTCTQFDGKRLGLYAQTTTTTMTGNHSEMVGILQID